MQYVPFGNLGFDISRLGMGCMRLPTTKDGDKTVIDRPEAIRLVRYGIDKGIHYVDTAYGYHNGESEVLVGLALRDGYRDKVKLATKLPPWHVKQYDDMDRILDEQLTRLQTDHVDFYLLHALNRNSYETMRKLDYPKFLQKAKSDGRIRYASFSFHDDAAAFRMILDDYDWVMAQVQMNILDDMNQATLAGMEYAAKKGVNLVIMEPLRGGALANPPKNVQALYEAYPEKRSCVEWAFRYLANMPFVQTILSGMSNQQQIDDNLRIFDSATVGCMSAQDEALIRDVKDAYLSRVKVGCTGCRYCMPCPQGVNITDLFCTYDEDAMFDNLASFGRYYARQVEKNADAGKCVACGTCEAACPQKIPIIERLREIHQLQA